MQPPLSAFAEMGETRAIGHTVRGTHARPLCTASNAQVCQINNLLPMCNEVLFVIGMELREQRCGSLSLVCIRPSEFILPSPPSASLYRANAFLRWLLRTHVCITSLTIMDTEVKYQSHILLEELRENQSLKKLNVKFWCGDPVENNIARLIPRLHCLEELKCVCMSPRTDTVMAALSELLNTATCLTSLELRAYSEYSRLPKTFLDALAANSTLTSFTLELQWEHAGEFWEYVRRNRVLTSLTLSGDAPDREDLLQDTALVYNMTLLTLDICALSGGETAVHFLTNIFAKCASLKSLSVYWVRERCTFIADTTLNHCMEALAANTSLEELKLPYKLWDTESWMAFFEFLPRNKYLKKIEVCNHRTARLETLLRLVKALERTKSSARVSFRHCTNGLGGQLMGFRTFSRIEIVGNEDDKVQALQRLLSLHHLTSVALDIVEPCERLVSSLAAYIRNTKSCRKLEFFVGSLPRPPTTTALSPWVPLFDSILVNTSIEYLKIFICGLFEYNVVLTSAIRLSRNITRVSYIQGVAEWNATEFILLLSDAIDNNYNLLEVDLCGCKVDAEATRYWFAIKDTTRRNSGLLERAAAFKQIAPLNWYTANALEKVSRHPALMRELAEREGMAEHEVRRKIRSRLMSVDGLSDFMQLTGVVKKTVKCAPPPDDNSKQLDDLNDDCWRVVRQYLSFDDVKRVTASQQDNSVRRCTLQNLSTSIRMCFSLAIGVWKCLLYNRVCKRLRVIFMGVFHK